jgi:transketolase
LSGDIGNRLFDQFKAVDVNRFYNCGIAEANMMGVAAGMAMSGLRPVVYTIAPFTTTRCFEQIRVDACYHHVPVVIVGTGAGLSYAELGPTHHSLEDIAILRTLPGMNVLAPCDANELRVLLQKAMTLSGPSYIRIGKKGEPVIHDKVPTLEIGKANVLRSGDQVGLICAGTLMSEVLSAAESLAEKGVSAEVASFHSIKPLDIAYLHEASSRFSLIVTIEEHGQIGGLSSAVAEWSVNTRTRINQIAFGTPDEFMHEVGTQDYARQHYGLTAQDIAHGVYQALNEHS